MKINGLDHLGIAVKDVEQALEKWRKAFRPKSLHIERLEERGVRIGHLEFEEGVSIELISPLGEDSPVKKFLDEKGEGIHHLCFRVENLGDAMEALRGQGVRFTHEKPLTGSGGNLIAFIHPSQFNGVLIELKEVSEGSAR